MIIDGAKAHDWCDIFRDKTVKLRVRKDDEEEESCSKSEEEADSKHEVSREDVEVKVVQSSWPYIRCTSYPTTRGTDLQVTCKTVHGNVVSFQPVLVLIRNEVRGVGRVNDFRHVLQCFLHSGVCGVNSLESLLMFMDRPTIHGQLTKLQRRVGMKSFPLLSQTCYASHHDMIIAPGFPMVAKVGFAHAGFGKMKLDSKEAFEDIRSVVAMADTYCTAENFIDGAYDLRIQKVGNHIRAFKRVSVSGNWKTNTGTSDVEEIEVTPQYRSWAQMASNAFPGGLDICTVDAIHCKKTGKEYILEVNGTSSGLLPKYWEEDSRRIAEVALRKIEAEVPIWK